MWKVEQRREQLPDALARDGGQIAANKS